jgi:hypothetical protein
MQGLPDPTSPRLNQAIKVIEPESAKNKFEEVFGDACKAAKAFYYRMKH